MDSVPENQGGVGLNHIEFVVIIAAVAGGNLCQTRLIVDIHPYVIQKVEAQ